MPKFTVVKHSKFSAAESDMWTVKNGRKEAVVCRDWHTGALRCYACNAWCVHVDAVTCYEHGEPLPVDSADDDSLDDLAGTLPSAGDSITY